jgi:xanthine dehydrogenase YagT iron-sulfur-binding subunit
MNVRLTVNGRGYTLDLDPRESLLDVLRERLDLTGTKKGCDQGACGACTVHIDGRRVLSCLTLAARCEGKQVTTIEGVAEDAELHPLQRADDRARRPAVRLLHPGQIMSGIALLEEGHAKTREEIASG